MQCDGADTTGDISVGGDSIQESLIDNEIQSTVNSCDISSYSDFLPYSNNSLLNNTLPEDDDQEHQSIQVITGNRNDGWNNDQNLPGGWITRNNNITVCRDNRQVIATMLPTIFVTNHRSFFPKFNNFVETMKTLNLTLGLHSEIWEDREKKDHMNKIEEALEIEGVQYISNPRPNRRGEGLLSPYWLESLASQNWMLYNQKTLM